MTQRLRCSTVFFFIFKQLSHISVLAISFIHEYKIENNPPNRYAFYSNDFKLNSFIIFFKVKYSNHLEANKRNSETSI